MKYTDRENNILVSFKRIIWHIGLLIGTTIPSVSSGEIKKSSHHGKIINLKALFII